MAMKNHKRLSVTRLLTPVALAVALSACTTSPSSTRVDISLDPNQPAQNYLMRADSSSGSQQNDWLVMALKASVEDGDFTQAELLIKRLARQSLSDMQQAEWYLARADLLIKQNMHEKALASLNFRPEWQLQYQQWKEYHQVRASLFTKKGDFVSAAQELIHERQFSERSDQQFISDGIWNNLNQYSAEQLQSLTSKPLSPTLAGWVELASFNKSMAKSLGNLQSAFEKWFAANPRHPAATYTPKAISELLKLEIKQPVNTALLLPLTGKFSKQSQLVRDGFMLEMMNDKARGENETLTVIDTDNISVAQLEAELIQNNIDFIVGPLIKENIEKLQQAEAKFETPVPMLALNIPEDIKPSTHTCYLALSPDQEFAEGARYLAQEGYQFPLILAPEGRVGNRAVKAFKEEWQKHSPNKVAVELFGEKRQLQRHINQVFGLQESQQNISQMRSVLRRSLETQPRSRRDIDAVYIVASSGELTLIKPFIEVAINPDTVPPKLFANSYSNNGRRLYEDLSDVTYGDIPLLVNPDEQLKAQMDQLWPKGSFAEKRLQALGMDAYRLIDELPQMKVIQGYTVQGHTGILSIDQNCVVQRELSWTEFEAAQ